jgi:MoxR-like ATPase
MAREDFEKVLDMWRRKKKVILQGPPGVGKAFVAHKLAFALMSYKDRNRVGMVQFHQSNSYEDFIQGYRPSGDGFILKDGIFFDFCRRAAKDQEAAYVVIVDKINRGNLILRGAEGLVLVCTEIPLLLQPDDVGIPTFSTTVIHCQAAVDMALGD